MQSFYMKIYSDRDRFTGYSDNAHYNCKCGITEWNDYRFRIVHADFYFYIIAYLPFFYAE